MDFSFFIYAMAPALWSKEKICNLQSRLAMDQSAVRPARAFEEAFRAWGQ